MHPLLPSYSQLPSGFFGFLFFSGQQLTAHLNNIAYPNDYMAVSKGCPVSDANFAFTASSLERKTGFYSTGIIRIQKLIQLHVGFTQLSMPFLPMDSSKYLEKWKQRQRKKNLPLGLTTWFQAWIHRISESLGWVPALEDHLVYVKQSLGWAIQGPVTSSHEYFQKMRVQFFMLP